MTNRSSRFARLSFILSCSACLAPAVWAQNADPKRDAQAAQIEERFKAADKNGDGKLTLEEAKAGMPRVAANFDRVDTDKRGYITLEQIKKMAASR
jgi:Ca2+-binding EF-hand superfamily protein